MSRMIVVLALAGLLALLASRAPSAASSSSVTITVDADREQGKEPSLFRTVHVHFAVRGPRDEAHLSRAVELSMSKYCSVARILEPTAAITWSHTLESAPA